MPEAGPAPDEALLAAADRLATLVAACSPAELSRPVPGGTWTVHDAATHVAVGLRLYVEDAYADPASWPDAATPPTGGLLPGLVAASNRQLLEAEPQRGAGQLAAALHDEAVALVARARARGLDDPVPLPWYLGAGARTAGAAEATVLTGREVCCVLLGEVLVHGWDVARALGRPWPLRRDDALTVLVGVRCMLGRFVDPRASAGVRLSQEVRPRGGERFWVEVSDGRATVATEAPDRPVDCHLWADPAALVLVGYGRRSQWWAVATGRFLAWGRRPWAGLRLARLFLDP